MAATSKQPKSDEIEISVFGPGYGEAILVHVGAGEWVVVDSCWDARARRSPVLHYLSTIGVDPNAVVAVVVSHWHSDHVRGISDIALACSNADFWISAALNSKELLLAARAVTMEGASRNNPYSEFVRLMDIISIRNDTVGRKVAKLATEGMTVLRRPRQDRMGVRLEALSPSQLSVDEAHRRIAALLPGASSISRTPKNVGPNHAAIALWVELGDDAILLGSDLEESGIRGWTAVLAHCSEFASVARFIKVPHHGSTTSHHDGVWQTLLASNPDAVVTPFRPSGLPRNSDIQRLLGSTGSLHISADVKVPKQPRSDSSLERATRGLALRVWEPEGITGQIRARWHPGDADVRFDYFGPAHRVAS